MFVVPCSGELYLIIHNQYTIVTIVTIPKQMPWNT